MLSLFVIGWWYYLARSRQNSFTLTSCLPLQLFQRRLTDSLNEVEKQFTKNSSKKKSDFTTLFARSEFRYLNPFSETLAVTMLLFLFSLFLRFSYFTWSKAKTAKLKNVIFTA